MEPLRTLLKSKIHRARVTGAFLDYEGSISIDPALCDRARLMEFEKVDIYNCTNGSRFSTYVIFGAEGEIALNGAAARLVQTGDEVIIASYVQVPESSCAKYRPRILLVDSKNKVKQENS